jgi:hypothetical protein
MKYLISFLLLGFSVISVYAWEYLINSKFYHETFIKIPACTTYDKNIKYYDAITELYEDDIENHDKWYEASKILLSFEFKKRECIKQKAEKKNPILIKQMKSICLKGGGVPLKKFAFDKTNLNWITWDWVFVNISWKDVELWITTKVYFGRLIMSLCDCQSKGYDIFAPATLSCFKL